MFISIKFDSPIKLPEARRLGVDGNLAQLVVGLGRSEHEHDFRLLSDLVFQFRVNPLDTVVVTAVNEFRSISSILPKSELIDLQRVPNIGSFRVGNAASLAWILEHWSAESLVLVEGNHNELIAKLDKVRKGHRAFWKLSSGSDRDEYLALLQTIPALCYFSQSHGSIHMVGRPEVVHAALKRSIDAYEHALSSTL